MQSFFIFLLDLCDLLYYKDKNDSLIVIDFRSKL